MNFSKTDIANAVALANDIGVAAAASKLNINPRNIRRWCDPKIREKRLADAKAYYANNKDVMQPKHAKYREENRDICNLRSKQCRNSDLQKARLQSKKRYERDPLRYRKLVTDRHKIRIKTDPGYKLICNLRHRFKYAMRELKLEAGIKRDDIGCTRAEAVKHIESQFYPDMTWDNHGILWDFDHIKPLHEYDLTDIEQQLLANHYTNIRPLYSVINRILGKQPKDVRDKVIAYLKINGYNATINWWYSSESGIAQENIQQ